jgi:hypothetical protein
MKSALALLLILSLSGTATADARRLPTTPSEAEDMGYDCHFNYESGRYYGNGCPTPVGRRIQLPKHDNRAMDAESRGLDCHFNYESGRYYGRECPQGSEYGSVHTPMLSNPELPSDNRN